VPSLTRIAAIAQPRSSLPATSFMSRPLLQGMISGAGTPARAVYNAHLL
jgi:hypothetical protein